MADQEYKGSIILKILILAFILILWQVISIPGKIWKQENSLKEISRQNMEAIYEAQNYYYTKTQKYAPSDSLEKLLAFIESDTSLQKRRRIGQLTQVLDKSIANVFDIPVFQAILPISQSVREIDGELNFNARYFEKYDHIIAQSEEILMDLPKFNSNSNFPTFCLVKSYIDSLNYLKENINDFKLQTGTLLAQRYIDTLIVHLEQIEMQEVNDFWSAEYDKIMNLINDIKQTDIVLVSSVVDRLRKFIDRINNSIKALQQSDLTQNIGALRAQKAALDQIHQNFLKEENFLLTKNYGLLQLSETDSILINLTKDNFFCPDTIDGQQRYIIHFREGNSNLIVESPNLLGDFQTQLVNATAPLEELPIFPYMDEIKKSLDSTIIVMTATKDNHRLGRYSTDILLNMKEIMAEIANLETIKFYRYTRELDAFIDTVKVEKRLSLLKPMIEDILNPMDTLATRIEMGDIKDFENRMNYFGKKIQQLDSMITNSNQIPARVRRRIEPSYPAFEQVYEVLNRLKSSLNPQDAQKIRQAADEMETALLNVLTGYEEPVYAVFTKKHENHGFIENGKKSWEGE